MKDDALLFFFAGVCVGIVLMVLALATFVRMMP
jgi:hypothetical protein